MDVVELLSRAIKRGASDIFIVPGTALSIRVGGVIEKLVPERLTADQTEEALQGIYALSAGRVVRRLSEHGDDDFSISIKGVGRFRVSAYRQRGSLAAVLRVVSFHLPDPVALHIPDAVVDLHRQHNGMVLVTGPAGSGKTTTLACIVDRINRERQGHIITIEDPIEYLHNHGKSIVSQREIQNDTESFEQALRAALRQSPNVILLGEMRDYETIRVALTAAETGQLLLSTLHTVGAAKTIDRIIDVFPPGQQQQIRVQLSMVLRAVVSQQLIPTVDGAVEPAFEIMVVNTAVQNMIREGKVHQIDNVIYAGAPQGMRTMDSDIWRLYSAGRIAAESAVLYATNPDAMAKKTAGGKGG